MLLRSYDDDIILLCSSEDQKRLLCSSDDQNMLLSSSENQKMLLGSSMDRQKHYFSSKVLMSAVFVVQWLICISKASFAVQHNLLKLNEFLPMT